MRARMRARCTECNEMITRENWPRYIILDKDGIERMVCSKCLPSLCQECRVLHLHVVLP